MNMKLSFFEKIRLKIHSHIVRTMRPFRIYPCLYISWWHKKLSPSKATLEDSKLPYFAARPNPGAGIGHQMANWIAGYWWASQLGCPFAHIPFSTEEWEAFLGFGEGETRFSSLCHQGYTIRRLPLFNETDQTERKRTEQIVASYKGKKVILLCEQDQGYQKQYEVIPEIQKKFQLSPLRDNDKFIWSDDTFHIAVHIRRGDIVEGQSTHNMRWLDNNYYRRVMDQILSILKTDKPVHIYLFSQGQREDYSEMSDLPNLYWCLDMPARESFIHLVNADILVTSKSSFSYKPALLNSKGIKVCPRQFWHGYPESNFWILCENDGNIIESELCKIDV